MKIGYPCINNSLDCTANSTFKLRNYSEKNLKEKIQKNLECLKKTLEYNVKENLLFFRIGSGLIPFAGHEVCKFNWQEYFRKDFEKIGKYIKKHEIRISMHPDQFTLLNAKNKDIVSKSIKELNYHCEVLDLMKLGSDAKIQIHVGGVYGDKKNSIKRFIENYKKLPEKIKKRLVIENDDKSYSVKDCLKISKKTKIPILFDCFHHECLNSGETKLDALKKIKKTWKKKDGIPMTDYSSQKPDARRCSHVQNIDLKNFKDYIKHTREMDFDIMLEIKDKEKSALRALEVLKNE
jgi:UV DNA damage endonuclease